MASASFTWPQSDNPNLAWEKLKVRQRVEKVRLPEHGQPPNTLRLVCISDTHNLTEKLVLPPGDVLVHAGDFSNTGEPSNIANFNEFLKKQPHPYKVVIAGNHDLTFDLASYASLRKRFHPNTKFDPVATKALLTGCTYLEDSGCVIDGVKFWGSPWQPEFFDWAFNLPRGPQIAKVWDTIPAGVDVLITHGPPIGHGDQCSDGAYAGCVDLLKAIQTRIHPRVHVFGHIHEGYGVTTDGNTTFINASTCTFHYKPLNKPVVFDVPKPEGFTPGLTPL